MKNGFEQIPLAEFDNDREAIVDPSYYKNIGLPPHCVIPFFGAVIEDLKQRNLLKKIYQLDSIIRPTEIFTLDYRDKPVTIVFPNACGAPLAGAMLEELIALGCHKFVACGCAGLLKSGLNQNDIIIPNRAIRDEGTSYHYLPPSRIVTIDEKVVNKLETVLQNYHIQYEVGLTWTTDAPYRETRKKIEKRKKEGCLTVEMECSALFAVAKYRNVELGQYLLVADDVSGEDWDSRKWSETSPVHEKVFWLSVEACLTL